MALRPLGAGIYRSANSWDVSQSDAKLSLWSTKQPLLTAARVSFCCGSTRWRCCSPRLSLLSMPEFSSPSATSWRCSGNGQGPASGGDRRIFSSSLQPFLFFSWRTSPRPQCGQSFSGSRATWPRSAMAGISPVFRTRRSVTVMSCSRNRGGASARSVRSTGCLPSDVRRPLSSCSCNWSGTTGSSQSPSGRAFQIGGWKKRSTPSQYDRGRTIPRGSLRDFSSTASK